MISESSEISAKKMLEKFTTKLSKFQQRDLKVQICNYGSSFFLRLENALTYNVLRIGERCGTASSVCSAKIDFLRKKQA
jgi:hypothetical protein